MKEDVQNLVRRARKQMAKKGDFPNCTTHTVDVLSAYAGIGALVGVFRANLTAGAFREFVITFLASFALPEKTNHLQILQHSLCALVVLLQGKLQIIVEAVVGRLIWVVLW
jgi:type III secretory pathway component EscT